MEAYCELKLSSRNSNTKSVINGGIYIVIMRLILIAVLFTRIAPQIVFMITIIEGYHHFKKYVLE